MSAQSASQECNFDELVRLRAENVRLREKLLELAQACAECDGTGLVTVTLHSAGYPDMDADDQPCGECLDIRDLLE